MLELTILHILQSNVFSDHSYLQYLPAVRMKAADNQSVLSFCCMILK